MRESHHRRVLEKVIIPTEPEAVAVGLLRLETGAVESLQLTVFVGYLGTLDLQGKSFSDTGDHIVEQFGVRIHVFSDHVVQIVVGQVLHGIEIRVVTHLLYGRQSPEFALPYQQNRQHQQQNDRQKDFQKLFHRCDN